MALRGASWLRVVLVVALAVVMVIPLGWLASGTSDVHYEQALKSTASPFGNSHATDAWGTGSRPSSSISFSVVYTLDLCTNKLYSGNALPTDCSSPGPRGVTFDSGKGEMFVANWGTANVSVISDVNDKVVATVPVGSDPYGSAYDGAAGEVFVANANSDTVSVISDASNKVVATIPVGTEPLVVAYDSGRGEVFVSNDRSENVSVISVATNKVVATTSLGTQPSTQPVGVVYDSGKGEVFVANSGFANVSVISDASNKVVAEVPVGQIPAGLAYDLGNVDVTNAATNNVSVISDTTDKVVATVPVGSNPVGVAYDGGMGELFVVNYRSNNVSVISDATNKVVATTAIGSGPLFAAYDPTDHDVYVSNSGQGTISIISDGGDSSHFPVTFSEKGLSSGTTWSVALNGTTFFANGTSIVVYESNGTHAYTVGAVSGYTASPSSGSISVNGAGVSLAITFTAVLPRLYPVTFSESGLPTGTSWTVTLGGMTNTSVTSKVNFTEPNGTIAFSIGIVAGYVSNVTSGNVTVNNGSISLPITFTPQPVLFSVTVSPSIDTIQVGVSANFTASITCTGGSCPSGTAYAWSLNTSSLGILNTTSGSFVKFTANATAGAEKLSVNATLHGNYAVNSSFITITTSPVPILAYVSLTPLTVTVSASGTQSFAASVGCSGGTCPAGTTYGWSLNNSLGKLNASSGPQVLFTANSTAGLVNLTVMAHLNGKTTTNSSAITITKSSPPPSTYTVTFTESGLPSGTSWSVTLNGTPGASSTSSIVFSNLLNNTTGYAFTVGAVSGYTASPSSGSVVVNGANVTRAIAFTKSSGPTQYSVTFAESGLPTGTSWSVILNGTTKTSATTTLTFSEPNTTYSYTVTSVSGYSDNPSSGSITVNGGPTGASITFTAIPAGSYSVTFGETGLPTAANWSVTLSGKTTSATGSTITFTEKNGTYNYSVTAPTGYTANPSSGSLTVAGKAISQSLTFTKPASKVTYTVTFTETGLPSGTSWWVILNGTNSTSTTSSMTFSEKNGTYNFTVATSANYGPSINISGKFFSRTGSLTVVGKALIATVEFTPPLCSPCVPPSKNSSAKGFLGLPGNDGYIVIGVVAAAAAIAAAVLLTRHRTKKSKKTPVESGVVITNPNNNQQTNVILKDN